MTPLMGTPAWLASSALAAEGDAKTSEIGPGLLAFGVVAALVVATVLLVRSMLHQLRKVPPTFDATSDDETDR